MGIKLVLLIVCLIYFWNIYCLKRLEHYIDEESNLVDKVGRALQQKPCAIEIDGCRYAFADEECRDDYYMDPKIINGEKIDSKKYPFMVSLRKLRSGKNNCVTQPFKKCYQHFCGGSLILDDVVLTAAHCVEEFIDTKKSGRQEVTEELLATRESKCRHQDGVEDLFVGWIEIHPNYSSSDDSYKNDIALLYLRGLIEQSDAIINFINSDLYESFAKQIGNNAGMIGFGDTALEPEKQSILFSSQLKEAWTRVREYSTCLDLLSDYGPLEYNWTNLLDNDTMICTYNQRSDTCDGDSGGPLFIQTDNGEYVLLGITSWGPTGGCFSTQGPQAPSVFARVSYYENFILDAIRKSQYLKISVIYMPVSLFSGNYSRFSIIFEDIDCESIDLDAFFDAYQESLTQQLGCPTPACLFIWNNGCGPLSSDVYVNYSIMRNPFSWRNNKLYFSTMRFLKLFQANAIP